MRPRSPGCSSPEDEKGMLCCGLPGGITSLHDNHATLKRPISCFKIERFLIFNKCLPEIGVRVRLSTPCHLSLKVILRLILEFEVEVVCLRLGTRMGRLTSCVSLCSTAVAQATPSGGHSTSPDDLFIIRLYGATATIRGIQTSPRTSSHSGTQGPTNDWFCGGQIWKLTIMNARGWNIRR